MIEEVRKIAGEWLGSKKIDRLYGLRQQNGDMAPYLFENEGELKDLALSNKHRVCFVCRPSMNNILGLLQEAESGIKLGIVARGCDERALIELSKRGLVKLDNIQVLGVACTKEDAEACQCSRPYPNNLLVGQKTDGVSSRKDVDALLAKSLEERAAFWKQQLSKCVKCYGCRNACPECFCHDCKLEQDVWVKTGQQPPEYPMFHFIRFYHLADRCVECGACEKACPVDIPLLTIYRLMRKDIKELFDYESGADVGQESPLLTTLDVTPLKEGANAAV